MKIFIIGLLVASATMVSAQGLLNRYGVREQRRQQMQEKARQKIAVDKKEADELAEKIAAPEMQGRIKGILDEPTPVKLEEFPFREAVVKAKAGDAEGYFALAYHYAVGKEIASDSDKAKLLLRKSADMNYPLGILVLAMVEELRLCDDNDVRIGISLLGLNNSAPHIGKYLSDYQYTSGQSGFGVRLFSADQIKELVGAGQIFEKFSARDMSRLRISNPDDIAYIKGLYEKAVALNARGAKNELKRFSERMSGLPERMAVDKSVKTNAQFAKEELGIPVESRSEIYRNVHEENERARQRTFEERLSAIEQQLREKGMLK